MKIEYLEGGKVKTITDLSEVDFNRPDGQVEIKPKRGKSKLKAKSCILSVSE